QAPTVIYHANLKVCPTLPSVKTLTDLGEFGLITLLTKSFNPTKDVMVSVGDDCAVLKYSAKEYLLWTTDLLLEGVHFTKSAPAYRIGWKALAVSLSDIAAMAGKPRYALVFVGLPAKSPFSYAKEIYRGIADLAQRYGVQVVGGDTNAYEKVVIGTTVLGVVKKKHLTLRSGSRPGNLICVSGHLGRGKETHLSFLPKVKEAGEIKRRFSATAMIDISDGLLSDFTRIAEQSKVGGRIFLAEIPAIKGISKEEALTSGEEFQLLFTVRPDQEKAVKKAGFFIVGEVTRKSSGIRVLCPDGRPYRPSTSGFNHFPISITRQGAWSSGTSPK
ncbi:MAG: thiamine-phosphate kinase, partial [Candidatus Omnitrophota bacterium]